MYRQLKLIFFKNSSFIIVSHTYFFHKFTLNNYAVKFLFYFMLLQTIEARNFYICGQETKVVTDGLSSVMNKLSEVPNKSF